MKYLLYLCLVFNCLAVEPFFSYNISNKILFTSGGYYRDEYQWGLKNTGQETKTYNPNGTVFSTEPTGNADVNILPAWEIKACSDILIAVIDDCFLLDHEEFQNIWWINPETGCPGVRISGGIVSSNVNVNKGFHGTTQVGIIAANGNNGVGISGVLRDGARIMPVSCADSYADLGRGMEFAVTNGAKIILFAYGYPAPRREWTNAFRLARDSNCIVVCSASENNGHEIGLGQYPDYPAQWVNDFPILNVGALTREGKRYAVSGYSTNWVDVFAPGRACVTTFTNHSYTYTSGTSPAAAYVAGYVAILWETFPRKSNYEILSRIKPTVKTNEFLLNTCSSGGYIDVFAGLNWYQGPSLSLLATNIGVIENSTNLSDWIFVQNVSAGTIFTVTNCYLTQEYFRVRYE